MEQKIYDLIIIGAGPGGYEAALHAAHLGLKVALVEEYQVGGTCLNRGCIPTKILLHAAHLFRQAGKLELFGLSAQNVSFDMEKVCDRKDEVQDKLRGGILALLKKAKVDVCEGRGRVTAPGEVCVTRSKMEAEQGGAAVVSEENNAAEILLKGTNILIATGAGPRKPPIPGAMLEGVYTSDDLLTERKDLFERLIIIGGGVIGCEFATIYNALGSQVVILEAESRILPLMDKEVSQSLSMSLKKKGGEIHTGAMVSGIAQVENDKGGCEYRCSFTEKEEEKAVCGDGVLISIGRAPNTEGLFAPDLVVGAQNEKAEAVGGQVRLERGFIKVDERFETDIPGVYAVGDVIGGIQLAHVATAEGIAAVEHMAGAAQSKDLSVIPSCIYTEPEIASVGLTTDEAKAMGVEAKSCKYSMLANGKSMLEEQERGFIKIVYRREDQVVIGAQLMCARATDLVAELALAISAGLTKEQVRAVIHPHPTFSEGIGEAVKQ